MQCCDVVELLSAYYDGEVSHNTAEAIREHIDICDHCAEELKVLNELSALTAILEQPTPPRHVWPRIEAQLNKGQPTANSNKRPPHKAVLAMAALVLIGLSWVGYRHWHAHEHQDLAVNFGQFLDNFAEAPDDAQNVLVKNYSGIPIEISDAIRELKYRPVVAVGLPDDYELAQAYLLKMPCCRCLEACYRRKDGGMLCVFEHDKEQPIWFGERSTSSMICSGKQTRLVQFDGCLAATWQQQQRYITVIGAKDVAEVSHLVAHFQL